MAIEGPVGLRKEALGFMALATVGAVLMSPAMSILANWGPMAGIVGEATPLVFFAAFVVSIPSAVSYAILNRRLPAAGSAYAWIARTVGPASATWIGLIMAMYYLMAVSIQPICSVSSSMTSYLLWACRIPDCRRCFWVSVWLPLSPH